MTRYRISTHFVVEEFDCHDGTRVPTAALPALESLAHHWLEPMRDAHGACRVVSGFRPPAYNRSVGGEPRSFHLYDRLGLPSSQALGAGQVAADLVFARGRPMDWQRTAQALRRRNSSVSRRNLGGVGRYDRSGFVHVDSGPRRDWTG